MVTGSAAAIMPSKDTAYTSIAAASQRGKSILAVTLAAKVCPSASFNGTSSTGRGAVKSRILARWSCWVIITHSPHFAGLASHHQDTAPHCARQQPAVVQREWN